MVIDPPENCRERSCAVPHWTRRGRSKPLPYGWTLVYPLVGKIVGNGLVPFHIWARRGRGQTLLLRMGFGPSASWQNCRERPCAVPFGRVAGGVKPLPYGWALVHPPVGKIVENGLVPFHLGASREEQALVHPLVGKIVGNGLVPFHLGAWWKGSSPFPPNDHVLTYKLLPD